MQKEDEEFILKYQKGDDTVLEELFKRYKLPILNFALRILSNRADAEDVTSDVFLALFSKKYTHLQSAKFSTWLFKIAHNSCIDKIRKRKRMAFLWFEKKGSNELQEFDVCDSKDLPSDELNRKEISEHVRKAVSKLPIQQKEALALRQYHDLSYIQISEIMECSLENVKILIFRARERLKTLLPSFILEENNE